MSNNYTILLLAILSRILSFSAVDGIPQHQYSSVQNPFYSDIYLISGNALYQQDEVT